MTYSVPWLLQELATDKKIKYLPFWGHRPANKGQISSSCLSQWWAGHPFVEKGVSYLTAEHYMMAGKARLFADEEALAHILAAKSPGEAKDWGRKVQNFVAEDWEAHRCEIVIQGNMLKFSQHQELSAFLIHTHSRILVEASPVDRIWGIGLTKDAPEVEVPASWKGLNLLGFCLMEVRDSLS